MSAKKKQPNMFTACRIILFFAAASIFSIIHLPCGAGAVSINFGSTIDKTSLELMPGETKSFNILFLNTGDDSMNVRIDASGTGPYDVNIIPGNIFMPGKNMPLQQSALPSKWYILDDGVTYVGMYLAQIYVTAPGELYSEDVKNHTFSITATAYVPETGGLNGIKDIIAQSRVFPLTITPKYFEQHIKPRDEPINMDYDQQGVSRPAATGKSAATDKTNIMNRTNIYDMFNMPYELLNIPNNTVNINGVSDSNKQDISTILVLVICLAALVMVVRA